MVSSAVDGLWKFIFTGYRVAQIYCVTCFQFAKPWNVLENKWRSLQVVYQFLKSPQTCSCDVSVVHYTSKQMIICQCTNKFDMFWCSFYVSAELGLFSGKIAGCAYLDSNCADLLITVQFGVISMDLEYCKCGCEKSLKLVFKRQCETYG